MQLTPGARGGAPGCVPDEGAPHQRLSPFDTRLGTSALAPPDPPKPLASNPGKKDLGEVGGESRVEAPAQSFLKPFPVLQA